MVLPHAVIHYARRDRNPRLRNPRKDLQIYRTSPHLTDGSDRRWYIISALQLRHGPREHFESIGKTPVVVTGVAPWVRWLQVGQSRLPVRVEVKKKAQHRMLFPKPANRLLKARSICTNSLTKLSRKIFQLRI